MQRNLDKRMTGKISINKYLIKEDLIVIHAVEINLYKMQNNYLILI